MGLMPALRLTRSNEFKSSIRKIKVFIDGWEAGTIANGETRDFMIAEGVHNLRVSLDGICSSQVVGFTAGPEETVNFYMYHKSGIALLNMLLDGNNYFILERR